MNAWMEIVNANGDDEWLQKCDLAMREIQRVALHRAAEKIRATWPNEFSREHAVADLIDPEVSDG